MTTAVGASPYDALIGRTLAGGWTVSNRVPLAPGSTGGHFSVGYNVTNPAGETAFCKVLDFQSVLSAADPLGAIQQASTDFQHEVLSLESCRGLRMNRVILALESETTADFAMPASLLSYIIFEPAIGDIRAVLPLTFSSGDLPLRFALLHDAAIGLGELHGARIAHQDIKPSNLLAIGASPSDVRMGKIADLGRAIVETRPHRFDALEFPGDRTYAPPEYMYRSVPTNDDDRRKGADLYQLGSLTAFVVSGAAMPALVKSQIPVHLRWGVWRGDYVDIEPVLRDATERAVEIVVNSLPNWCAAEIRPMLLNLCDPDPKRRNAGATGVFVSRFSLAKVVSLFDRMQKLATYKIRATP